MQERRGRSGRGERRGDLTGDQPGLAEAGDDDAALRVVQDLDRAREGGTEGVGNAPDGRGLEREDPLAAVDELFGGRRRRRALPAGGGWHRTPPAAAPPHTT